MEIKELLDLALKEKASDLLITAGAPPMLRINGELLRTRGEALTAEQSQQLIFGFLAKEQRLTLESAKELDFSLSLGRKYRFRVNVYYQKQAVTAALRPIPDTIPGLRELGLPEDVDKLAAVKQGLVLVTGPTGHGKTTTQAAIIDFINNTRACHVITIEDPIEYVHTHKHSIVDQREVGGDTLNFANGLKFVLRQSPDVILIGEMRDLETIQAALRAAETGHLVLATLHTNDAVQTVDRIIDVFPADQQDQIRTQFSMALAAVIAQRLVPRIGGGRVAAYEVLMGTSAISNIIREGKVRQLRNLIATGQKDGMMVMEQSLAALISAGVITYEDAMAASVHPDEIAGLTTHHQVAPDSSAPAHFVVGAGAPGAQG